MHPTLPLLHDLRRQGSYQDDFLCVALGDLPLADLPQLQSLFHYFEGEGSVAGHPVSAVSVARTAPRIATKGQYCSIGVKLPSESHHRFSGLVQLDQTELNEFITSPCEGVTLYPSCSRRVPGKPGVSSGWFTQSHKDAELALSEATWTALRSSEVEHYHTQVTEYYIVKEGSAVLEVNGIPFPIAAHQLLVVPPSWASGTPLKHKLTEIRWDDETGRYGHLCFQFPAIFGSGRIVTEENAVAAEALQNFAR